jgi:porphobilinogen synthase
MQHISEFFRFRRNRKSAWIRDLTAETTLLLQDLILPNFVIEGKNIEEKINTLPDVSRFSVDLLIKNVVEAHKMGIKAIMLFPVISQKLKSENCKEAFNKDNLICKAIKKIKDKVPEIGIICDVALDPYTISGHDGIVDKNGMVLNDETTKLLCKQALTLAEAGCDIVAPSDMMDGRVMMIRRALDTSGFADVGIMSYSAKYASNFYGPFRCAVGSAQNLKKADKKTYQMDFRNGKEAMREIAADINEGADSIIIKPATAYLDIIKEASQNFDLPIITYQVSGEYAMLKFGAKNGCFNFIDACYESLTACKRAGASAIISYASLEMASFMSE